MLLGRYGIDLEEKEHNLMTIEYFNYRCNRKITLKEVLFQEFKDR